jgi:hypothetical protein
LYINDLTFDAEYIYAATSHQGVWRRKISDLFTTSISHLKAEEDLIIFPNPANTSLNASFFSATNSKGEITLVNLQGQVISKKVILENPASFDTSRVPPGLYVVIFHSDDIYKVERVIIQH